MVLHLRVNLSNGTNGIVYKLFKLNNEKKNKLMKSDLGWEI